MHVSKIKQHPHGHFVLTEHSSNLMSVNWNCVALLLIKSSSVSMFHTTGFTCLMFVELAGARISYKLDKIMLHCLDKPTSLKCSPS